MKKFGLETTKHARTPMGFVTKLSKVESGKYVDKALYRSLLYLTSSSPDIGFNVGVCARYQVNRKQSHV